MNESLPPGGKPGADARRHGADCLKLVGERLVNLIEHESLPGSRKGRKGLTAYDRAYAGQVLGQSGDPRRGVGVVGGLPDSDWLKIPPGKFLMGDEGERHGGRQFKCGLIKSPYHISRYPITVAQYQIFVNDKGYEQERFWTKGGWEWRTDDTITGPEDDDNAVFQTPNHPRVGVSWFEAVAFCGWFGEKLGRDIRLPSEAEWERAARGEKGRLYPWGDATNFAERCNCDETGLGHTSAVGLFPSGNGKCGAADMAGTFGSGAVLSGWMTTKTMTRKSTTIWKAIPIVTVCCAVPGGTATLTASCYRRVVMSTAQTFASIPADFVVCGLSRRLVGDVGLRFAL